MKKNGFLGPQLSQKGFTLIELLVVIAIIALLAAILFPVFARARENARRASCQSNLKQIGLGIAQYSQDYDERMPSTAMGGTSSGSTYAGGSSWQVLLQPYVKSYQIFACPSNTRKALAAPSDAGDKVTVVSYAAPRENRGTGNVTNGAAFGNRGLVGPILSDFPQVAQTIMVADANVDDTDFRMTNTGWVTNDSDNGTSNTALYAGHLSTMNVLFVDGHVKAMKPLATASTAMGGSGTVNMWNRYGHAGTGGGGTDVEEAYAERVIQYLTAATSKYP